MSEIKTVHELLDTNDVGLIGEPLLARVSHLVADWKFMCTMRDSYQKALWDIDPVLDAADAVVKDHDLQCEDYNRTLEALETALKKYRNV